MPSVINYEANGLDLILKHCSSVMLPFMGSFLKSSVGNRKESRDRRQLSALLWFLCIRSRLVGGILWGGVRRLVAFVAVSLSAWFPITICHASGQFSLTKLQNKGLGDLPRYRHSVTDLFPNMLLQSRAKSALNVRPA